MFDSPTYSGRPHPLSKVLVPEALVAAWMPFARSRALRLRRERALRLRDHDLAARVRPRGRPARCSAAACPGWPTSATRGRSSRCVPTSRPRPSAASTGGSSAGGSARADAVVCVSGPAADGPAPPRDRRPAAGPERLGPGVAGAAAGGATGLLDPYRRLDRLHRPLRQLRPRSAAAGRARSPSSPAPTARPRRKLELVIAGPLTDEEAELFATDVSPARIVLAGSLERERALALQREADALLLVAQPTRSQLLNIKLFEYLASGSPILALAAGTEAGRVAGELGAEVVAADDPAAIAAALARVAAGELAPTAAEAVAPYTYPAPAEGMAAAVETAISRRRGR